MPITKALHDKDFDLWLPLWNLNNLNQINEAVTQSTWERLMDPDSGIGGIAAFDATAMVGILHYVVHPVTGQIKPVAYMQDLYVLPSHRRRGVARQMITALHALGEEKQWSRIYWLAEGKNQDAQALYKNIGVKLDFTLHVLPVEKL
jgi:GNAT superfamily N-acetyltransferase